MNDVLQRILYIIKRMKKDNETALTCALKLEPGDHERAVVHLGFLTRAKDGDVEVELFQGPVIGLSHVLTGGRDVSLRDEEISQHDLGGE